SVIPQRRIGGLALPQFRLHRPRHPAEVLERLHVVRPDPRFLELAFEERDGLVEHPRDLRPQPFLLERPEVLPRKGLDLRPTELGQRPTRVTATLPCTTP